MRTVHLGDMFANPIPFAATFAITEALAVAFSFFAGRFLYKLTALLWRRTPISRVVCEFTRLEMPSSKGLDKFGYTYLSPLERMRFDDAVSKIVLGMRYIVCLGIATIFSIFATAIHASWGLVAYPATMAILCLLAYAALWLELRAIVTNVCRALEARISEVESV